MSQNKIKELSDKLEMLETKVIKMQKNYDEVLDSLDESNFSPKFLNTLKKLASNPATEEV